MTPPGFSMRVHNSLFFFLSFVFLLYTHFRKAWEAYDITSSSFAVMDLTSTSSRFSLFLTQFPAAEIIKKKIFLFLLLRTIVSPEIFVSVKFSLPKAMRGLGLGFVNPMFSSPNISLLIIVVVRVVILIFHDILRFFSESYTSSYSF